MTKGWYSSIRDLSEQNSYLVPNTDLRGVGQPYVKASGFLEASALVDPAAIQGTSVTLAAIPSPIVGKYIHLPDGNVSAPGLAWAGEVTSGRYRIGSGNAGESILGTLVYDWNASRVFYSTAMSLRLGVDAELFPATIPAGREPLTFQGTFDGGFRVAIQNLSTGTSAHADFSILNTSGNDFAFGVAGTGATWGASFPIAAGEAFLLTNNAGGSGGMPICITTRQSNYIRLCTNATERIRILGAGAFLYGATTQAASESFRVVGTTRFDSRMGIGGNPAASEAALTIHNQDGIKILNTTAGHMGVFNASNLFVLSVNRSVTGTFTDSAKCASNINLSGTASTGNIGLYTTTTVNSTPTITMTVNGDKTVGIGTADGVARRSLEVLHTTNPQLRLTHTDNVDFCDFLVDTNGLLTISSSSDAVLIDDALRVGTATDAADAGDFVTGLTGAARAFYDQSVPSLTFYNSAGTVVNLISSVASTATVWNEQGADIDFRIEGDTATHLFFLDASTDFIGINTSGPDARLDILDSANPQLRLTHTDGVDYCNFQVDGNGDATISPSGGNLIITSAIVSTTSTGVVVYQNTSGGVNPLTFRLANTGGDVYFGLEDSGGTFFGATAYDAVIYSASPFNIMHDGTSRIYVKDTENVFNEPGNDIDLRAEGDNKTSCLLLDASDDEVAIDGRFSLIDSSPSQITGDQNNYAGAEGTATSRSTVWRLSSDAARNITGIAGGLQGRVLKLVNVGAQNIVIQNQNASSTDVNRVITGTGADITLAADDTMDLWYDSTTQRWRVFA